MIASTLGMSWDDLESCVTIIDTLRTRIGPKCTLGNSALSAGTNLSKLNTYFGRQVAEKRLAILRSMILCVASVSRMNFKPSNCPIPPSTSIKNAPLSWNGIALDLAVSQATRFCYVRT